MQYTECPFNEFDIKRSADNPSRESFQTIFNNTGASLCETVPLREKDEEVERNKGVEWTIFQNRSMQFRNKCIRLYIYHAAPESHLFKGPMS